MRVTTIKIIEENLTNNNLIWLVAATSCFIHNDRTVALSPVTRLYAAAAVTGDLWKDCMQCK